jgi:F-type H+-transporting ATPase subunit alpha
MIRQPQNNPIDQIDESIMLFAIKEKFIKWIPIDNFDAFKHELIAYFKNSKARQELAKTKALDDKIIQQLRQEFKKFIKQFVLSIQDYNFDTYGPKSELE